MAIPSLRVLGDRVLICPDTDDRAPVVTEGGIVTAKSLAAAVTGTDPVLAWSRGTVIAVGQPRHPLRDEAMDLVSRLWKLAATTATFNASSRNATLIRDAGDFLSELVSREPCVAIGDDVLFAHDAGQEIVMNDQPYILLREHELLAVVTSPEEG